jgi:pyridoxine/pyridoxamine 5'-phosphate oxidase
VSERLTSARTYWVGTTRPDGRPHTAPVWGVWMDEAFTFATARDSRKGRNLAANPALVVHLDSGEAVVILEGLAKEVTDPSLLAQFADAYEAKYRWRPDTARAEQVVYALRPRAAFTWQESDFPESGVRWRFDGA